MSEKGIKDRDGESSALYVDGEGSDRIIIAFAGLAKVFGGVPAFEFIKLLSDVSAHKLFLVDHELVWYQNGLPGMGDTVQEVADYLRNECRAMGIKRVVAVGNSAGGFAAILFGVLIGADEVHAFAPKTRILGEDDFREMRYLDLLRENIKTDKPVLDLRTILQRDGEAKTKIFIHYPERDDVDVRHAHHLADCPGVQLIGYPCSDHALVQLLKRHGILKSLLCSALDGDHSRLKKIAERGRRTMTWKRFCSLPFSIFGRNG